MCGWCNRLLRVDLSAGRIWAEETAPRVPAYLGARGLAAKILWDEYPDPVDPFDARNPLMLMPGALTGTRSPYSGRMNICTFSPQSYPYTWFTRASIGLDWGAELKHAGYDGVVITGASDRPVQLVIEDDRVRLLGAEELWGLDAHETQEATKSAFGRGTKTLTIGPAGERLSRIATVHTGSTSVAGQGGFGAVMGAKKLKAISVCGTGHVAVADPERLQELYRAVADEVASTRSIQKRLAQRNEDLQRDGGGKARLFACTASCPTPCQLQYSDIPGIAFDRKWSGVMNCVSGMFSGGKQAGVYGWNLGFRGGFELSTYANALGLNHWEILVGIIPWLRTCEREGLLRAFDGRPLEWGASDFWVRFLHDLAYREGMGDALAEGGYRAAGILGLGEDVMRRYYTGWGYSGHWDGHAAFVNYIVYPFWIVGALHWAMDTRDPASSTHDYVQNVMYWGPFAQWRFRGDGPAITWDHMRGIGQRIYGRADTLDPLSGYEGKAIPAARHAVRSVMKDTLPTDDQVFPLIYSHNTEDRYCRVAGMDGLDVDAALLRAGSGLDWDTGEFEHAAERVLNLERALTVRHWGRDRQLDERVLPSFEYDENWVNPETHERHALDRAQFAPVLDEYYTLRGWDPATGQPTPETLSALELGTIHAEMVAGGERARARLPELGTEGPITDYHRADPERTDRLPERVAERK
jgi:aldehyde:ferredoxin oxidoreductase